MRSEIALHPAINTMMMRVYTGTNIFPEDKTVRNGNVMITKRLENYDVESYGKMVLKNVKFIPGL
jgi:hypothetical protein